MNTQGIKRLQKEYKQLQISKSAQNFVVVPDKNFYVWHFVIFGLKDSPYEDGYYHGKILFPTEYPMKPPGIMMLTPSGRFETGKRICLSMSDYHPETWNPVWNTETIITALISFMNSDERTTGCVVTSTQTKRNYAHLSLQFNMKDKEWASMFKPLFEKMGVEEKKIKKSQEYLKKKVENDNKMSFIILSVICIAVAYYIALKFV